MKTSNPAPAAILHIGNRAICIHKDLQRHAYSKELLDYRHNIYEQQFRRQFALNNSRNSTFSQIQLPFSLLTSTVNSRAQI